MSVSEVLHSLGSFDLKLKSTTPREILDALDYFGHIAILPGRVDTVQVGDNALTEARYVGVLRKKKIGDDGRTNEVGDSISVGGVGVAFWLGDDDSDRGKGDIYETPQTFTSQTFANTVTALLPDAVTVGTLYSVSGTFTGEFKYVTPRTAVQYVCDTMSSTLVPVSWRVNGNGTLDAGPESDLYVTTPTCVVVRRGFGEDMSLRALAGDIDVEQDMEDFTTRVVLLAEGEGESVATGSADISGGLNPYKDLHGNALKLTRLVSEAETSTSNATARAQLQLNRFTGTRDALTLGTNDYDIHGSFEVGDYIWVYDPDAGLVDTNNEIYFRGERLNPIKLQVHETSWAVTNGYSVGYRDRIGTWYDLTDYIDFEAEATSKVTVGEFSRTLSVSGSESVGTRPVADTSTPDTPTWVTPFQVVNYQDDLGFTRSRVLLAWSAPNNTDGSTVIDGDHYEIQVRVDTDAIYQQSWASVSSTSWNDVHTWDQPFTPALSAWQTFYVAWGESSYFLNDLATGVGYDVRIRGVDTAGNIGNWEETTFVTTQDNIAPSTPAAPSVAGSRIAVQVTHQLGKATGGTFNLEGDLHHLEIHVDYEPHFTPTASTLKGTVLANQGSMIAQIPAVQTVQVEETSARYVRIIAVDKAGNKSLPSDAASATALLIDDAHISDLTVTKVTAGTISADWIVGARIKTSDSGARVELNSEGLKTYNAEGLQTVNLDSATGTFTLRTGASGSRVQLDSAGLSAFDASENRTVFIDATTGSVDIVGRLRSGDGGKRIDINPPESYGNEIRFYPTSDDDYALIRSAADIWGGSGAMLEITSNVNGGDDINQLLMWGAEDAFVGGIEHRGTWFDNLNVIGDSYGTIVGEIDGLVAGATSVSYSYGATSSHGARHPVVTVDDNGAAGTAAVRAFNVQGNSTTGFNVNLSGTANGAWTVHAWITADNNG